MSGVLCLTEIADSIPMWTHYAAGHRGFAIGFDTTSDLFQKAINPDSDSPLSRVRYESDRPVLTGGRTHPDTIFFKKSKEWEYEHEWRWLELRRPEDYAKVVAGPEGQLLYLRCISPKDVRRIVLGLPHEFSIVRIGPDTDGKLGIQTPGVIPGASERARIQAASGMFPMNSLIRFSGSTGATDDRESPHNAVL